MIYELSKELATALAAKSCPIDVVFGPEATETATWSRERIVLQHDDDSSDSFGPVRSQRRNPQHRMTRNVPGLIRIYAKEQRIGAQYFEHLRRAEHVLDLVLVALERSVIARKNGLIVNSGRFFQPVDFKGTVNQAGAAYELKFTVERAVFEQTWAGAARPEGSADSFSNSNHVSLYRGPDSQDPETACGDD